MESGANESADGRSSAQRQTQNGSPALEIENVEGNADGPATDTIDTERIKKKYEKGIDFREKLMEINEAVAFMDYSFERAFTMQEKQYTAAYQVS